MYRKFVNFINIHPRIRVSLKYIVITMFISLVALLQTHTIWDFFGERVDENAIFHFSIGFFGGDFNPQWDGYGHIGMYLLYFVYIILFIPFYIFGKFTSFDEYAMQIFYNGYFVLVARYIFAAIGFVAVLVYSRIAKLSQIPIVLVLLFIVVSVLSKDAIHFANYLRTDQLVGFFVALSIYFAFKSDNKIFLYFLAVAIAGAISSKISALPLVVLLGIYTLYRVYDKTITWHHIFGVGLTFLLFLFIFQPYVNYFEKAIGILKLGAAGRGGGESAGQFNWGKTYQYNLIARLKEIYYVFVQYCSLPVILSLPLLVFSKKYFRIVLPSIVVLILLIIPYVNSPEITYYWFLPAFNLVRFLSLVAIASLYYQLSRVINEKNVLYVRLFRYSFSGVLLVITSLLLIWPSFNSYIKNYQWQETNKAIAQRWIEENLLENEFILLEGNVDYNIPQVYDAKSIKSSMMISRAFLHNREGNDYLNSLFKDYLTNHYNKQIDIAGVKGVKQIRGIDFSNEKNVNSLIGKFYVTSPVIYNRYLKRSSKDLNPKRKKQLEAFKNYFNYMISNPLYKKFDEGRGAAIEIYQITNSLSDYRSDESEGYKFSNQWAKVEIKKDDILCKDLTISIKIKILKYPKNWVSLISKFESDSKNEFNIRIRGKDKGQFYFGDGNKAYVCSWNPEAVLPIGKWVNITATRNFSQGQMILYADGKVVASSTIPVNARASQTKVPIQIMGDQSKSIDGQLKEIQILSKAINPNELRALNDNLAKGIKFQELIGYWNFTDLKENIVKDLSSNRNDVTIYKR